MRVFGRFLVLFGGFTLTISLLTACSDSEPSHSPITETATAAATAAATEPATETATATAPAAPTETATAAPTKVAVPMHEVVDVTGRTVMIPVEPKVIVALSPTAVEFVYAAGGTVAGRPSTATHPEEALTAAEVGTAYSPSQEAIIALQPDLIILDSTIHFGPEMLEMAEMIGVPAVYAGAASLDDVYAGLELLGSILGTQETVSTLIGEIKASQENAYQLISEKNLSTMVIVGDRERRLYAANNTGYVGDLLTQVGLTNLAADLPNSSIPGFGLLAPEVALEMNPPLILVISPGAPPAPLLSGMLGMYPGFSSLDALKTKNVFELDVELFLQSPGPRVQLAFDYLVELLNSVGDDAQ